MTYINPAKETQINDIEKFEALVQNRIVLKKEDGKLSIGRGFKNISHSIHIKYARFKHLLRTFKWINNEKICSKSINYIKTKNNISEDELTKINKILVLLKESDLNKIMIDGLEQEIEKVKQNSIQKNQNTEPKTSPPPSEGTHVDPKTNEEQETQKQAVNDHGGTQLKTKMEGEDHGISSAYSDVSSLNEDIPDFNTLRSSKEDEKLKLNEDYLQANNNFYQPINDVKTAKERLNEVLGHPSNGSYEVTTNPKTNNFQIRFLANSSEGLEKIKQNISYQYALRGQTVPDFSRDSWRNDGNPLTLTLSSNETFSIFGFHRTDEEAKFDDIMRDLDGFLAQS